MNKHKYRKIEPSVPFRTTEKDICSDCGATRTWVDSESDTGNGHWKYSQPIDSEFGVYPIPCNQEL